MDSAAIADITVHDVDERPIRLGDTWRDRPAVLVWLRHFG